MALSQGQRKETTKQIIHYLNSCVKNSDNKLIERIEASGYILEYFGNATTTKNNNSSRFGKLIEVYYNKNMECLGMKIITYLLEKTRVLRKEDIGKFHIFNKSEEEIIDLLDKAGFTEENINFITSTIKIIKYLLDLKYGDVVEQDIKIKNILSKRIIKVQEEMIEKFYNNDEFNEIRDIFVMKIYDNLFNWIVERMNIICNVETYDYKIGILDIFGFEDLNQNSLEQLLINYTNEIIQGLLNKILIENKIELYKNEDINLEVKNIELNKEQIKLIEKIFINLDEECMIPKGSDNNLIQKLNSGNSTNKHYKIIKNNNNNIFGIEHYAGLIEYKIENFLKKNMDKNINEIEEYINELFNYRLKKKMTSKLKINSITNQFKIQINDFIESINSCDINFIKCIKSNSKDKPLYFDRSLVKEQLVYNGVLQLINILKQGHRNNFIKNDFIKKYDYIIKNYKDMDIIYGKTRVFLDEETYNIIQKRYDEYIYKNAIIIQKNIRMKISYNKYKRLRENIILLQSQIRIFRTKKKYKLEQSIIKIQNFIYKMILWRRKEKRIKILYLINRVRCINQYNEYYKIKNNINIIKSNYIIYKIRNNIIQKKKSIILIQKWWRSYLKMKNNFLIKYNILENELIIQQKINIDNEKRIISLELLNNELIEKNKKLEQIINNKCNIINIDELSNTDELSDTYELSDTDEYQNIDIPEKIDENSNTYTINKFKIIIDNLYNDIEHYKQDINNRITEKLNLVNQLDIVNKENKRLLVRANHSKNWFSMFFNN